MTINKETTVTALLYSDQLQIIRQYCSDQIQNLEHLKKKLSTLTESDKEKMAKLIDRYSRIVTALGEIEVTEEDSCSFSDSKIAFGFSCVALAVGTPLMFATAGLPVILGTGAAGLAASMGMPQYFITTHTPSINNLADKVNSTAGTQNKLQLIANCVGSVEEEVEDFLKKKKNRGVKPEDLSVIEKFQTQNANRKAIMALAVMGIALIGIGLLLLTHGAALPIFAAAMNAKLVTSCILTTGMMQLGQAGLFALSSPSPRCATGLHEKMKSAAKKQKTGANQGGDGTLSLPKSNDSDVSNNSMSTVASHESVKLINNCSLNYDQ
jgi:hypothetical protein